MSDEKKKPSLENAMNVAAEIEKGEYCMVGFTLSVRGLVRFANSNANAPEGAPIGLHLEMGDPEVDLVNPPQKYFRQLSKQERTILLRGAVSYVQRLIEQKLGKSTDREFSVDEVSSPGAKA